MTVKDLFDLSGKVAIVTGGSRGLGKEMVLAFAEQGADVVIASRKLDACEAVADEVRDRFGRRALPVACHVGRWDDVDRLADAAYDDFGTVDILVNNAGMSPLYGELNSNVTEDLWDKVQGVNLKGPVPAHRPGGRAHGGRRGRRHPQHLHHGRGGHRRDAHLDAVPRRQGRA